MTFDAILKDLKNKVFHPFYFFDGDEPYFVDALTDYISSHVLSEDEKAFNQHIVYAQELPILELIPMVKRYPMMAEHQVVIVREAQAWRNLDALKPIIEKPVESTILVINYKGKRVDGRYEIGKLIKKKTVYYTSAKLQENKMPVWISNHCKLHGREIEPKAASMLTEKLGNDLGKLINALEKLEIITSKDNFISADMVAKNVGMNKDFNEFELHKAIGLRNDRRALLIANYFANNQKDHHILKVLFGLYNFFVLKLIKYHSLGPNPSDQNVAKALNTPAYFARDYRDYAKYYNEKNLLDCIDILYDIDLKVKGVHSANADSGHLIKEMVARIIRT